MTIPLNSIITISTDGPRTALNTKAPTNNPTFTGTVSGITKAMVGLDNVDNTSDAAKPISTAVQTALDAKANRTELPNLGTFINDYRNDTNDPNNLVSLGRTFNSLLKI